MCATTKDFRQDFRRLIRRPSFGLLGVTVAYYKYGSDSAFNRFFNGNTLGLHFFIICSSSTKENLVFVDIDHFLAIYSDKFTP